MKLLVSRLHLRLVCKIAFSFFALKVCAYGFQYFLAPSLSQVQRPLFVLISKCGMARVREELKALDTVMDMVSNKTAVATSMLTRLQVHPAISMALLDAVRWHVHGYDK